VPAHTNGPHVSYTTRVMHMQFPTYSHILLLLYNMEKGRLGAPRRCERDTCPGERKPDAGHEFGPYATISPFSALYAYVTTMHQLFCSIFPSGRGVARNLPSTLPPTIEMAPKCSTLNGQRCIRHNNVFTSYTLALWVIQG
jgi:hypothetical protein